jgi:hypothetical protein
MDDLKTFFGFAVLSAWLLGSVPVAADENLVQTFTGTNTSTTTSFTVPEKWEARWDAPGIVSITVLSMDGYIVAGASGTAKGSLYQPHGGVFRLEVSTAGHAMDRFRGGNRFRDGGTSRHGRGDRELCSARRYDNSCSALPLREP